MKLFFQNLETFSPGTYVLWEHQLSPWQLLGSVLVPLLQLSVRRIEAGVLLHRRWPFRDGIEIAGKGGKVKEMVCVLFGFPALSIRFGYFTQLRISLGWVG